MDENIIIIDWLSFTSKIHAVSDIIDILGMSDIPWQSIKGARGYQDRLYFNGISIHFNGREDMGVWCEMSGQGCRTFETLGSGNYKYIFDIITYGDLHITRLDIAYDDHIGLLDIGQICMDTRSGEYVSKSDYWEVVESSKGATVMHGSPKSDIRIRIYDKAAERNCEPGTHWVRVELQLRDDRALHFIALPYELGKSFCGVICNYLRSVEPNELDTNRWRWPLKSYWGDFLAGADAISIYVKPGMEYNIDRCERYVYRQCGNAIDALIDIYGIEEFTEKLRKRGTRPNPKYQQLIDTYKDFKL